MVNSMLKAGLGLLAASLVAAGCGDGAQPTALAGDTASAAPKPPPRGPRRRPPSPPRHTTLARPVCAALTPLRHLLTVTAQVDGHGPYRFAIDSGSADALRVSPRLARRLHLERIGQAITGDPSGRNPVKAPIVRVGEVTIGAARFRGIHATVGTRLGRLAPDAIIGLSLFARLTATIDHPARTLRLSRAPLRPGGAHVVGFTRERGVPRIAITAAGSPLRVDVDTGGPAVLTVPSPETVPLQGQPRVVGTGRTATNEFEIRAAPLAGDLSVAGWTRTRPTVDVVDAFGVASIGAAFLRDYAVAFDMRNRRLALTRGAHCRPAPPEGERYRGR